MEKHQDLLRNVVHEFEMYETKDKKPIEVIYWKKEYVWNKIR